MSSVADILNNGIVAVREGLSKKKMIPESVSHCGKSTLLKLFQERLQENKVSKSRIIDINLEDIENEDLHAAITLYKHIKNRIARGDIHYVFRDEIQLASDYEEATNGLRLLKNVDLYVTGPNSKNSMVNMPQRSKYIYGLIKSFVFYKVERYYVKGREYLQSNAKYYAVDVRLRYFLLGNKGVGTVMCWIDC